MVPTVLAVHRSATRRFGKKTEFGIRLLAGLGVDGDYHMGKTVKHRSRDKTLPNLRQVHLVHAELFEALKTMGFLVAAGQIGENITTAGIDLLSLPTDTRLTLGVSAVVKLTGLRNPCVQMNRFQPGLMNAVLERDGQGQILRKSGVMGVVLNDGDVHPSDPIVVELPPSPHKPLAPV